MDKGLFTTTYTWTFTISGFSSAHNLDVTTTANNTSGTAISPDPITIQKPTASIAVTGGVSVATQTLGTVRMFQDGTNIDLDGSGSAVPPGGGGTLDYTWDYAGSGSSLPATNVADPTAYAVSTPTGYASYTIKLTVRWSVSGATAEATQVIYVKQAPTATLTFSSPSTSPDVYGDAPLGVTVSANVVTNDPFIEGGEDADANSTDYTFLWTFESGSTNNTTITGVTHTYSDPGAEIVDLDLTDDYGFTGTVYQNVYVTPLDKINFPSVMALPWMTPPTIDGIVEPTDTDGNGTEDVLELGWNNAFRATHANGTDDPVALQALRQQKSPTESYLLLSFEVNGDAIYDDNDVIVITFRPNKNSITSANDRRIFVFPVWNDKGACDAGGTGYSLTQHRFNKPPRAVEYYGDSSNWTQLTTAITEAAADANPGFFTRVHSYPKGTTYSWDVEVRVPLDTTSGGTNWITMTNNFLFYANVIRVTDRNASFGDTGYATQYRWPREAPAATGSLAGYMFPVWGWGSATRNSTLTDSLGVYIQGWNDIGFLSGSNIVNNITLTPDGSGNATIPFVARVKNNSTALIGDINVTFRMAFWGATLGVGGDWRKIPAANSSTCPTNQATDPTTRDHNPTCNLSVQAASGPTPGQRDFRLDWTLNQTSTEYQHFKNVQDHQCVYAEIDSSSDSNIIRKSAWNNLTIQALSAFDDTARISTAGCARPPAGKNKHRVILEVKKREWTVTSGSAWDDRFRLAAGGGKRPGIEVTSCQEYLVYAYYEKGGTITIKDQNYYIFEPIASFGYVFYHEADVAGWINSIEGARKVRDGLYVIDIGPESHEDIRIHAESVEPKFSLSLHGGSATPLAYFSNSYTTGFCAILDFGYELSPNWSLVLNAGFNYLPGATSSVPATSIINVGLDIRFTLPFNRFFYSYAQAGPNLYIQDFATFDAGYNGGLGAGFALSPRFRIELGADYHSTFGQHNWLLQTHLGVVLRL